jgi:hypothetical protein
VLDGLTRDTFLADSYTLALGGDLVRDVVVTVSANYSKGAPHHGETGSFTGSNGTAQLAYRFAQRWSLVTSYSYYRHELRDVSLLPVGIPPTFERQTLRVGIQMWLPLYGSFARRESRESSRN